MVDDAILSMSLLTFRQKNLDFSHRASVDGEEYLVFHRTETESEAKLRPRLVRLFVVVPSAWVIYVEEGDELVIGRDGIQPGPAPTGTALEAQADPPRFDERGIAWARHALGPERILYVPAERAPALLSSEAVAALGLGS